MSNLIFMGMCVCWFVGFLVLLWYVDYIHFEYEKYCKPMRQPPKMKIEIKPTSPYR